MKKEFPKGLYAICGEEFSNGRNNIDIIKEILDAGVKIIQYREKKKSKLEKFKQCEIIRKMTLEYGAFFVVNDDLDIALAVTSDGVHIGQDDLPIAKARDIVGQNMLIGLSSHCHQQAQEAVKSGADYIGVGPIFKTSTKVDVVDPVGFEYLDYCVKNISLPKVAIGGIKLSNIAEVAKYKPENICMVTEIVGSKDIAKTIKLTQEILNDYY